MNARHSQRGVVLPSPVVLLSIVAVVMAAVAFFVTRGDDSGENEIATTSVTPTSTASADGGGSPTATPSTAAVTPKPVKRSKYDVVIFNNTSIKGLAATVSAAVTTAGWRVVGTDNWYGSIPKTTVYYPPKFKRAAKQLALDLGIKRTATAENPMSSTRLTVILTGPLT